MTVRTIVPVALVAGLALALAWRQAGGWKIRVLLAIVWLVH